MAPESECSRAASGMSIEAEAVGVGLALVVALVELLGLGEAVDEVDGVGEGVGSSSPPLQPAKANVAAVAKATAYVVVVRDFIVRNPSMVRCPAATQGRAKHRDLSSRVENAAVFATRAHPRIRRKAGQRSRSRRSRTSISCVPQST